MCKLFAVLEIEDKKNAEIFVSAAVPLITKTDDDGLGIMRLGERGIHIQRWLEASTAGGRQRETEKFAQYSDAVKHQKNESGRRSKNLYAIAVHGRMATCDVNLANTHPFYRSQTALMHNGVITNASSFDRPLSTCDSEAILTRYIETSVELDPTRLTEAVQGLFGYYAAIVFTDAGTVDIWRDNTATLFIAHVRGVGIVLATTAELITQAAKRTKARIMAMDEMLPFTAIRWTNGKDPRISSFDKTSGVIESTTETEKWWEKERLEEERLENKLAEMDSPRWGGV